MATTNTMATTNRTLELSPIAVELSGTFWNIWENILKHSYSEII